MACGHVLTRSSNYHAQLSADLGHSKSPFRILRFLESAMHDHPIGAQRTAWQGMVTIQQSLMWVKLVHEKDARLSHQCRIPVIIS